MLLRGKRNINNYLNSLYQLHRQTVRSMDRKVCL